MESISHRVASNFMERISSKRVEINSGIDVLKCMMQIIETYPMLDGKQKKEIIISTMQDIAAGRDGILGTSDDVIPLFVVHHIQMIVESEILSGAIDVICEATKGLIPINQSTSLMMSFFKFWSKVWNGCLK